MFATLFNWIVLTWLCFLVGTRLEDSLWKVQPRITGFWQLPLTLINGLAGWALIASVTSLFWPLNWETLIKYSGIAILESAIHFDFYQNAFKKRLPETGRGFWRIALFVLFAFGVFFLKSVAPSEVFDEGAYYRPFITGAEYYGTVPGLGNLNLHSALNSSWHVLQALFGMKGFWFPSGVYDLNGLLCTWILGMAGLAGYRVLIAEKSDYQFLPLLILFALPAFVYRNLLTGPSSDIPSIALSWLVWVLFLLRSFGQDEASNNYLNFSVIWLGVFVFTVKLTSVMMLLPGAFVVMIWLGSGQKKQAFLWILICILVLTPHLYRNYLLSGYLFYPLTQVDLFSPEWKVPIDRVQNKFYLAQFGPFAPPETYSFAWLRSWFLAFNPESRVIIGLAFLLLVSGPFVLLNYRSKLGMYFRVLYVSMLAASLVWLFSVTEPRYGFGTLLILALAFIALLFLRFKDKWILKGYFGLIIGLQSIHFIKTVRDTDINTLSWMDGSSFPKVVAEKIKCDNFEAFTPIAYENKLSQEKPVFCWDTQFPCLPKEDTQDAWRIVKRTAKISDGFKSLPAKP